MLNRFRFAAKTKLGPTRTTFVLIASAYFVGCIASFSILPPQHWLAQQVWVADSSSTLPAAQEVLGDSATPRPTPTPVPSQAPQAVPAAATTAAARHRITVASADSAGQVGFAAGSILPQLSASQLNTELNGMRSAHATWVRFDVQWDQAQPDPAKPYNWGPYDTVTKAVVAHGMRPIGIIDYTPAWARPAGCGSFACEPQNVAAYATFAAAAAAHFSGMGIHTWEIWNEPNNAQFFQPAPDAAYYVSMLRAAYSAIHSVDASATVLTGGLAPAGDPLTPPEFLTAMYQAGARGSFDAIADHPYTWPETATTNNPYNAWGQMVNMRAIMVANGDAAKRIWITEYGAPTAGSTGIGEAAQSQMVGDFFTAASSLPWLGPILWYSYQDSGADASNIEDNFGLVRADGTQKPAYSVFAGYAASY